MHQPEPGMILLRKATHTITTDTIKLNSSSPLIHSYQINVHKRSKDSARIVLNNPIGLNKAPGVYHLWRVNMPCVVPLQQYHR
jgi:hypothetical protein